MTCAEFERWLDEGRLEAQPATAMAHAAACNSCARALVAAEAVERFLALEPPPAPAGFTRRVMARVETPVAVPLPPALPWWMRAALEPAAILAMVLLTVVTWGWRGLLQGAYAMAGAAGQGMTWLLATASEAATRGPGASALGRDHVMLGLELGALCLMLLAVPGIYRSTLRLASRVAGPRWR